MTALIENFIKTIPSSTSITIHSKMAYGQYDLIKDGICVINPNWMNDDIRKDLRKEFIQTCHDFPEFDQSKVKDDVYVLGGFSALGNPGSFHNPFVRKLREWCMWSVVPILSPLAKGRKLEQAIDRMMYRTPGKKVASESWHRDEAPKAEETDDVFGGWINLDEKSHYFSCIPGSHIGVSQHSGFGKVAKEDVDVSKKTKIEIPPGHIIVFFERILHEVSTSKVPKDGITRLFLGWRLTHSSTSLYDMVEVFDSQAVPNIKSDQVPAMYSTYHKIAWVDMLEAFSGSFKEVCLVGEKIKGRDMQIVPRYMPSLKKMGMIGTYPEYTIREYRIYVPNTEWELSVPGVASSRRDTLRM